MRYTVVVLALTIGSLAQTTVTDCTKYPAQCVQPPPPSPNTLDLVQNAQQIRAEQQRQQLLNKQLLSIGLLWKRPAHLPIGF
jgi:hypothetical protein